MGPKKPVDCHAYALEVVSTRIVAFVLRGTQSGLCSATRGWSNQELQASPQTHNHLSIELMLEITYPRGRVRQLVVTRHNSHTKVKFPRWCHLSFPLVYSAQGVALIREKPLPCRKPGGVLAWSGISISILGSEKLLNWRRLTRNGAHLERGS
ncbi:hypothetical protein LIA77_09345 [Sarocladium implicatum]|nr:hypothetical protein LIA77_09345 [Sarocladium implicatum]